MVLKEIGVRENWDVKGTSCDVGVQWVWLEDRLRAWYEECPWEWRVVLSWWVWLVLPLLHSDTVLELIGEAALERRVGPVVVVAVVDYAVVMPSGEDADLYINKNNYVI